MELYNLNCKGEKSPQELCDYLQNELDIQECQEDELNCIKKTIYFYKGKLEKRLKSCGRKKDRLLKSIVTGCKKILSSMRKFVY